MTPVIETHHLCKRYGSQVAVNDLTLEVAGGEIFGFLGPNGAGKTTTILMLMGLSQPTRGTARVCGFDPTREPVKVKRIVGYLPAKPSLVFLMLFTSAGALFSLAQFVAFFGPLIGLVLGFDAINRERTARTLSKLLAQPIHRDAVINGKFLAGLTTVAVLLTSIVLLISGLGLWVPGVVPGAEEAGRLLVYLLISVVYMGFWLGLAILCSVLFRSTATSALAVVALWIFLAFLVPLAGSAIADSLAPLPAAGSEVQIATVLRHARIERAISYLSPITLYTDATDVVLDPMRKTTRSLVLMGPIERLSMSRFQNPLPLGESALVVAPHLVLLIAITLLCFGICYASFMRQEIRTT